ncbi:head decoration protein [Rhizobium halophytocola]|uniref:Head decoration protein n=1 Tax=Rhizobium halophytocola TaxID=735519 RepID=A0ABS4E2H7_9HYPH|nr:head decoration protein [Rhizobium halophytocola]MBP1852126.1 hypothetical protein [Rhizobium halophytocola]
MTILTQDLKRTAHYIVSEASGYRSREQIVIASGSGKIDAGAVLGQVTATAKYVPFNPAGGDGSETARAVLYEGCDATSADVRCTVTARDTEIQADVLGWVDGTTDIQKTAALASLAALGIVAR